MRHLIIRTLAIGLLWLPLSAATSEDSTAESAAAVEAEIREELDALRARLLQLEAMLDSLSSESSGAAPAEEATESEVAAVEPVEAVPLKVGPPSSTTTAVTYAEPDEDALVGVASSGGQAISFTGLLDAYYTHNTNQPGDGFNTLYYTNPNARGFGLNQAKLEIDASGDGPIGFRSDIWFGSGARLFRDGLEPGPLEDVLYLQQAYGYYQFANGSQLDVGLFGTIAGLEVAESHLNWNYTRGILWAWNEPFSHLGAKFSTPVTDTLTATFMLVNGFDNAWDQNTGKSYGLQGSFAPSDRFNTTLTWINGPENPNEGWRKNLSWNFYGGLHDRFEIMANLDYIQDNDGMASATSWGMGGYARVHLTDQVRLAYRMEFLDDSEARSTGVNQNLRENTITFEVQPVKEDPRFLTRVEYRRDWSDVAYFGCTSCDGGFSMDQNTFTVGFMWVFGPKE
ncbi:MAG: outer membrane beta-barrel protein [Bryobacterales bacterium]|nr:outer membrane beta-barrel protein [Bryobacterales bacterium]